MTEVDEKPGMSAAVEDIAERRKQEIERERKEIEEQAAAAKAHFIEVLEFCRVCIVSAQVESEYHGPLLRELFHHVLENERIEFNAKKQGEFLLAQAQMASQMPRLVVPGPGAKLKRN